MKVDASMQQRPLSSSFRGRYDTASTRSTQSDALYQASVNSASHVPRRSFPHTRWRLFSHNQSETKWCINTSHLYDNVCNGRPTVVFNTTLVSKGSCIFYTHLCHNISVNIYKYEYSFHSNPRIYFLPLIKDCDPLLRVSIIS